MNEETLEWVYQESLEERLIYYLAEVRHLSLEQAMDIYYSSKLADKIYAGLYDIQYLDYKVLTDILIETEPRLFVRPDIPTGIHSAGKTLTSLSADYADRRE